MHSGDQRDRDGDEAFITATREVYRAGQAVQKAVDAAIWSAQGRRADAQVGDLRTAVSDVQMTLTALKVKTRSARSDGAAGQRGIQAGVRRPDDACSTCWRVRSSPMRRRKPMRSLVLAQRWVWRWIRRSAPGTPARVTVVADGDRPGTVRSEMETGTSLRAKSNMPLVAHGACRSVAWKDISFATVKRAAQYSEEDYFQQQAAARTAAWLLRPSSAGGCFAPSASLDTGPSSRRCGSADQHGH